MSHAACRETLPGCRKHVSEWAGDLWLFWGAEIRLGESRPVRTVITP